MVKRSGRTSSINLRNSGTAMLMMECWDESLSQTQIAAYKEKVLECQRAQEKVREAHRLAQLGKAIVTVLDDPRKRVPPPTLQQLRPDLMPGAQAPRSQPQEPQRSTSPDIIFIGESPPLQKTPPTPPTQAAQTRPPLNHSPAVPRQIVQTLQMPGVQLHRFPSYPQTTTLQIQGGNINVIPQRASIPSLQQLTPVEGTFGIGVKRTLPQQHLEDTSPKRKRVETDSEGNWVPLDEFYYGKMEGDPAYSEEKNEFRFKCWYCNKMLYNNIKAMMHIQGHIDSSKQQNIDLSDLTQCKHCYRQFDTPFEMQTHVEKVHMNNVNVLMCRICERDHQSRQALMTHMRVNHNACEMPYICHLCKFRSSMYSDVVDHFKKKHDSSQHILCLYCLKVFAVKFVSQGWGQTQTYYGHLLKHQSKSSSKKCTYCRLTFVNPADCKTHKKKDHAANQKGIDSRHGMFGQDMMIKVPDSGLSSKQALKSLNAPAVSKVLDFGGTRFPYAVNYNSCVECKTVMGTPDHFRKHIECSMCRFATSCSIAYANHMMGFHSGQMSSLNLNIPWERPMKEPMHCLCGFVSRYGNKIANHLVYCTKRSCYSTKPAPVVRETEEEEDQDPRYKPGASLLDALGLVKKKNVSTKDRGNAEVQRRRSSEEPSELIWKSTKDTAVSPAELIWKSTKDTAVSPTEDESQGNDGIPQELKGAEKWKTVKIQDSSTPSKASVFLGEASEPPRDLDISKGLEEPETSTVNNKEEGHSTTGNQGQSEQRKQRDDSDVSTGQSNEEIPTETQPQLKNMEEIFEGNVQSISEGPQKETEKINVDDNKEKAEAVIVKQEKELPCDATESETGNKTEVSLTEPLSQTLGNSDSKEKDAKDGEEEQRWIESPEKDSAEDSKQQETGSTLTKECTQRETLTDLPEEDKKRESLTEVTEVPIAEEADPVPKEVQAPRETASEEEKGSSEAEEMGNEPLEVEKIPKQAEQMEDEPLEEEKIQNQAEQMEDEPLQEEKIQNQEIKEDAQEKMEVEEKPKGEMEDKLNDQDENVPDDVSEEKSEEASNSMVEGADLISESFKESKEELQVTEEETMEIDEVKNQDGGELESEDKETNLEEMSKETKSQSEKETEKRGETLDCENKTITEGEEAHGQSSSTGNDSPTDGGKKRSSRSDNSGDKRDSEAKGSRLAEVGEGQHSSETSDRSRESHPKSSSWDEKRSDETGHHSSHHHSNRSHGIHDHRSPSYDQYDRPHEDRGWSRQDRHSHGDRDGNRHHGQTRSYRDNRHHYDRNRYDDGRHGHHDNRHGYHDSRHGYHDNRSSRGQWRGHGGYRGGGGYR